MSRKNANKELKRKARERQAQSAIDAVRHEATSAHPGVSVRRAAAGESYSTALSRTKTEEAFRRLSEEMRAGREGWRPGPAVDIEAWQALPEVPLAGC